MGKLFRWTLLFVVLVIFASGAVAVYTVFFSTVDDVTMPALRDMSLIDAVAAVERLGLVAKATQVASTLPQGRVLVQSPEAGVRVRRDRVVILQVSQGGSRRPVPDVRNLDVIRAQDAIRGQGFEIGDVIRIKDDSQPAGTVIAQSPASPADIPTDSKIDLLVNQGGESRVVVPDVARMTERQARALLASNNLKVIRVDYVYTPNEADGAVTGTRPAAGATARAGDGVLLKLATSKRPGAPETPKPAAAAAPESPLAAGERASSQVVVRIPGQEDIVISDPPGAAPQAPQARTADLSVSAFQGPQVIQNPTTLRDPAVSTASSAVVAAASSGAAGTGVAATPAPARQANLQPGGKVAHIRYQVPPLARPLLLKIEVVDPTGTRVLLNRDARSGEYVSLDASYSKECAVTIYLGGEFVWQDKYM
ncbi:MAG: PASTA domain-containing protein [Synergistaceae bacterium]|jgi:serine/threonine-protein kinase|nr:PASTA domain-containing protein [Synergistaceae bacterium]